jgi:hypothetical protein
MKRLIAGIGLSASVAAAGAGQMPKYGVTVTAEKKVDFARFATYSWIDGQPSAIKAVDARVRAAVDRELAALGMKEMTSGSSDVLATYYSSTRTDVEHKAKPDASGMRPQYWVGTLVVALLDPSTRQRLLRMRADKPIEIEPEKLASAIDSAVAALFEKYPTRQRKE